ERALNQGEGVALVETAVVQAIQHRGRPYTEPTPPLRKIRTSEASSVLPIRNGFVHDARARGAAGLRTVTIVHRTSPPVMPYWTNGETSRNRDVSIQNTIALRTAISTTRPSPHTRLIMRSCRRSAASRS